LAHKRNAVAAPASSKRVLGSAPFGWTPTRFTLRNHLVKVGSEICNLLQRVPCEIEVLNAAAR
jgi:hypothetical protein